MSKEDEILEKTNDIQETTHVIDEKIDKLLGTPKKFNYKKILKIALRSIEITYVAAMLIFSLLIILSGNKSGTDLNSMPITHHTLLTVKTDSMKGEFDKNALVIARVPQSDNEILALRAKEVDPVTEEVIYEGDIISFKTIINGQPAINTHRIIGILNEDDIENIKFVTKGDNTPSADGNLVSANQVLAIYKTSIPELGGWITGIKDNNTFIWIVIVPLALLFIYNTFIFIRNLSDVKAEKLISEKNATLTEEEKEALKREYLKSLEEQNKK